MNSVLLPVILFRSTGIRLLIWTNIGYALTTLSIQTILSPDMGRSANHATSQSTHNLCGGRTLNKMKTIAEHQFRVVHLNGHQQVFLMIFLFDRLVTGFQNKISKSLIAHYCSYSLGGALIGFIYRQMSLSLVLSITNIKEDIYCSLDYFETALDWLKQTIN